jgi:hypothetical protein
MKKSPSNLPFARATREANDWAQQGAVVIQKWTCAGCGARLGGNPNHWTTHGKCDEVEGKMGCGHVTDIRKSGCGYSLVMTTDSTTLLDLIRPKNFH